MISEKSSKRCTGCKETKPLEDYPVRSNKRDGRDTRCKPCRKAADEQYRNTLAASALSENAYAGNMRGRYEKSRAEKPRCTRCDAKVNYSKVADPHRLCERCQEKKVSELIGAA